MLLREDYKMKKKKQIIIFLSVILLVLVIVALRLYFLNNQSDEQAKNADKVELEEDYILDAGNDLYITEISPYSGPYMEDGSDEEVSDVMMIKVTNRGEHPLQYAEITLTGEEDSLFRLSTLSPGETVMILEANRRAFDQQEEFTQATTANVVFFEKALNFYEDIFQIQGLDGGLNIKNISKQDVNDEIIVYFKDCEDDLLVGGITYRGRISDGLKAGEMKQLMSENFSQNHTKVMFVTIAGK